MKQKWIHSLYAQLLLIILSGITLAIVISALIFLNDREKALYNIASLKTAQRITAIVHLLDSLNHKKRLQYIKELETPLQYIRILEKKPPMTDDNTTNHPSASVFKLINRYLKNRWPLHIDVLEETEKDKHTDHYSVHSRSSTAHYSDNTSSSGISFFAHIQLTDGTWLEFHDHLPAELFSWSTNLLLSLLILFIIITGMSLFAIRLVTRPLGILSAAAEALGRDIQQTPLAETGPKEVRNAAKAFNTMQARLIRFLQERTHLLAALSHDLRTPITRMRLRAEMIEEEKIKKSFLVNLDEMEQMTTLSLNYIRGMEKTEIQQKVDIQALLENIQVEFEEMGHTITLSCHAIPPIPVMPQSLKRCVVNLVQNAINYAHDVQLTAQLFEQRLQITISDKGPGIPEEALERMFDPFVRLETSRNKKTGGTGLGLSIARNIARSHGGDLNIRNRVNGGLDAVLILPIKNIF